MGVNVEVTDKYISDFKSTYNLKDLPKQKTYFKNTENGVLTLF